MRMEHYFQAELRYLREQGQALTLAHPELSHYLAGPGADPDVERLLEGVAFLTASLQARMDDSFPELSLGVLQLVAPQLLRVIPSLTMMQFLPIPHTISQPMQLAAGCEVASAPVDGRSCRFRTCRPGWIYPADSQLSLDPARTTLSLTLTLHTQICQSALALDKLQLYLGDEQPAACELYLWLRQHLRQWVIETESGCWPQHPSCLLACGFDPADALLPDLDDHIDGHRLLQDYFSFPAAFLCLALAPDLPPPVRKPVEQVRLRFEFQHPLPSHVQITTQSIMLNCIPAVNLFSLDAEPIHRHGRHHDYPLHLSHQAPDAYELFSIDKVHGWRQPMLSRERNNQSCTQKNLREYLPFHRFQQLPSPPRTPAAQPQYKINQSTKVSGQGLNYRLSFIEPEPSQTLLQEETISISLTCCDRQLASKLPPGALHIATGSSPNFVRFHNLQRPTGIRYPASSDQLHWQLLNNLSHHYLSLLEPQRLQQLLSCYDRQDDADRPSRNRARITAIEHISTQPIERLYDGLPIRGLHTTLSIHGQPFGGEGELYLFGSVLAHFLAHYASINSFHQLEVINLDAQTRYQWPAAIGRQPLL